jgi:tryptophan halogenase
MTYKISIIGGGTAGWMSAAYLKSIYGDLVDISVIYDHDCPSIGVGESTTPIFVNFLQQINISIDHLIKEVGSTIKLGIKFKNWTNDENHFWHPFNFGNFDADITDSNVLSAYETSFEKNQNADCYSPEYMDSGLVPFDADLNILSNIALHIDGVLFSKFLKEKFKTKVTVIDDIVNEVIIDDSKISSIILKSGKNICADLYIDCTGLSKLLISKVSNTWKDFDEFPLMNRSITIQAKGNVDFSQTYTLAEAHKFGWLWKIPLQERIGIGYNYNSNYLSDDEAKNQFLNILKEKNIGCESDLKVIDYFPGYFEESWKSNVLSIGLSSGFIEPLEATSIHMICNQLMHFVRHNTFLESEFSKNVYNKKMSKMYEQTLEFIILHYCGGRNDSPFWKDLIAKIPTQLQSFINKCKNSYITASDVLIDFDRIQGSSIFGLTGYTRIMEGLKILNKDGAKYFLDLSGLEGVGKDIFDNVLSMKKSLKSSSISSNVLYKRIKQWQI